MTTNNRIIRVIRYDAHARRCTCGKHVDAGKPKATPPAIRPRKTLPVDATEEKSASEALKNLQRNAWRETTETE